MLERLQDVNNPVLGLAAGATPEGLYAKLIDKYNNNDISLKNTTTFNLDEYVGLSPNNVNSYHYYIHNKFFNHIDIQSKQCTFAKWEYNRFTEGMYRL